MSLNKPYLSGAIVITMMVHILLNKKGLNNIIANPGAV